MRTDRILYLFNFQKPRASRKEPQEGMVFDPRGIAPTVLATDYKGTQCKIIEIID